MHPWSSNRLLLSLIRRYCIVLPLPPLIVSIQGSSRAAILKYICGHFKVGDNVIQINSRIRSALKKGAAAGALNQVPYSINVYRILPYRNYSGERQRCLWIVQIGREENSREEEGNEECEETCG